MFSYTMCFQEKRWRAVDGMVRSFEVEVPLDLLLDVCRLRFLDEGELILSTGVQTGLSFYVKSSCYRRTDELFTNLFRIASAATHLLPQISSPLVATHTAVDKNNVGFPRSSKRALSSKKCPWTLVMSNGILLSLDVLGLQ